MPLNCPPSPPSSEPGITLSGPAVVVFGRILAGYGSVFVAGSLAGGMALDGFGPIASTSSEP
jgi:drug/metabolite transporter superfamily protein YnfA